MDNQAKTTAAKVLSKHTGFVISPNISEYALTDEEKAYRDTLLVSYIEIVHFGTPIHKDIQTSQKLIA